MDYLNKKSDNQTHDFSFKNTKLIEDIIIMPMISFRGFYVEHQFRGAWK